MAEATGGDGAEMNAYIAVAGLLAFLTSFCAVSVIREIAAKGRILDIPNERSSHSFPIPRGGGVAIVIICLAAAGFQVFTSQKWTEAPLYPVAAAIIAGVSFLDDLYGIRSRTRFFFHALAAGLILYGSGEWNVLGLNLRSEFISAACSGFIILFWTVGLTNAFNFMDGIDGIAGGQALVAGFGWFVIGTLNGLYFISLLGLIIGFASLGFLLHNWQPARIFMGDVGSTFLGFTFAAVTVFAARKRLELCVAGILLVWPFVFDSTFTLVRRLLHGENIFEAHRSHLYQRLVISGLSHARVSSLYIAYSAAGLILGVFWSVGSKGSGLASAILIPALALSLLFFVRYRERR